MPQPSVAVNKGALLLEETAAEMQLRARPYRRAGALFIVLGIPGFVPVMWAPNALAGTVALVAATFVLGGALSIIHASGFRYRARLYEFGVETPTPTTGWSRFHSLYFIEQIRETRGPVSGQVYQFIDRTGICSFELPAKTAFSERAARQALQVRDHRPRPTPTTNPWVAAPRVQSSRRAKVK